MSELSSRDDAAAVFSHPRSLRFAALVVMALTWFVAIWAYVTSRLADMPGEATVFMLIWLALAIIAVAVLPRWSFVVGFLASLLCMLVAWRIAGLYHVALISYPLLGAFLVYLAMFILVARRSIRHEDPALRLTRGYWQWTFIRIYIGFDLVPHFTEKLFGGPGPRNEDIEAFTQLGVPAPEIFIIVAGFCELGVAIGIGLGLLTRLAACCSALYFLIATILGQHFFMGFIWASPGGGWEYPVLMMVLLISFVIDGGGRFSLDDIILRRIRPPAWIRGMMVPSKN